MCSAERSELVGLAEPARERDRGGERVLRLLRQIGEQGREEQARCDRQHANAELRQLARDRQRHGDDAALGGRIGRLTDLAVIGRDGRRGDHHAALAGRKRLQFRHRRRRQPQHVERADQIDLDHAIEIAERHRAFLADHALGDADAGTVHQHARRRHAPRRLWRPPLPPRPRRKRRRSRRHRRSRRRRSRQAFRSDRKRRPWRLGLRAGARSRRPIPMRRR